MTIVPKTAIIQTGDATLHSIFLAAFHPRNDSLTVVILHGAGKSDSTRYIKLAEQFAKVGVSAILLDFVGHGKSSGEAKDNSLAKQTQHALAAIDHWTSKDTSLILCGFSMSGHTALRVSRQLGDRVKVLGLFCPAIYAAEAEEVRFGTKFTEILRTPDSWRSSLALEDAKHFHDRTAIVIGGEDAVIPPAVVESLSQVLSCSSGFMIERIDGVTHQLAIWLAAHPEKSREIVQYLVSGEK